MSKGKNAVRAAVLGSDRAFKVIDGGGGGGGGGQPPTPRDDDDDPCPVQALGDLDGQYYFLDPIGQVRRFSARELGNPQSMIGLFRNDAWLRRKFKVEKEYKKENGEKGTIVVDFHTKAASRHMIHLASSKGLFDDSVKFRRPGIWKTEDGQPVVHCGDEILMEDRWLPAGTRTGKQIWVAAGATPRPAAPCDHRVAAQLQQDLQNFWCYRNQAGPIALLGLLYSGYLCGALDWRCNGFVTGGTGSGKSSLRRVIRAAWPVHDYSNDTSKAGMEQTVAGRAIPAIIDESNDRNRSSGRDLVDIVLSASGDEGTKLARGTSDGKGRSSEVISSVIMFSINAPDLEPQHLNRFVMIDLGGPEAGADYSAEHRQVAAFAAEHARALWGRAISSYDRYVECLKLFRGALRERGCDPREMDGKGALLAGWYVLTHEGLPDEMDLRVGVAALGDFIVSTEESSMDDGPRRALQHLLTSHVQLHRSSEKEPVGVLLDRAYGMDPEHTPSAASAILANNGIKPVRKCSVPPEKWKPGEQCTCAQCWDADRQRPAPRIGRGDGLWIANRNPELERLFKDTPFDGGRWRQELRRLPTAASSGKSVRIGGGSGYALFLERSVLHDPG